MDTHDTPIDPNLAQALRRLKDAAAVPPVDPAREAALLQAFDAAQPFRLKAGATQEKFRLKAEATQEKFRLKAEATGAEFHPTADGTGEGRLNAEATGAEFRQTVGATGDERLNAEATGAEFRPTADGTGEERLKAEAAGRRDYWYLSAFAAAAAVLLAVGLASAPAGRRAAHPPGAAATHTAAPSPHDVRLDPPGEFVIVPGAERLPRLESGTLVRMDVPVSLLPSLGVTPPPGQVSVVTADLVVAQDGLPRAVRLVAP